MLARRTVVLLFVSLAGCHGEEVETPSQATDAAGSEVAQADASTDVVVGTCTGRAGTTTMIDLGAFCIDPTEVTAKQWKVFLAASDKPAQKPSCSDNTSFDSASAPSGDDGPIYDMDWCDADTYCRWAGKRLCGRIGGGSVDTADLADPKKSEWSFACRGGVPGHTYPYGDTFDAKACNGGGVSTPSKPGDFVECTGKTAPFDRLFDMVGNVNEWEDGCESAARTARCPLRGGWTGSTDPLELSCARVLYATRDQTDQPVGIRCCNDK